MTHHDLSLMRRLQAGDEQAMQALLAQHWTNVVSYAFGLLGSWDTAEDVAQDAFVRLWARREKWSEGSPGALLHRIARNAALDVLKSPRHAAPGGDPANRRSAPTVASLTHALDCRSTSRRARSIPFDYRPTIVWISVSHGRSRWAGAH